MTIETKPQTRLGMVRATVPLPGTEFDGLGSGDRYQVTDRIILAGLDKKEQSRIKEYLGRSCKARLEFFEYLPDFEHYELRDIPTTEQAWEYHDVAQSSGLRVSELVSLLALSARLHPNHSAVLADVWTGRIWKRIIPVGRDLEARGSNYSHFPLSRLSTWSSLCENWPEESTPQMSLALDYYLDSIWERQQGSIKKSYLSGAIAVEVLVGYQAKSELTRTISQRGAHLVAAGADAATVAQTLRKLYGARSSLVHSGKDPRSSDLTMLQQYLMAALPSAAAAHPLNTHRDLTDDLDAANFGLGTITNRLNEGGWWGYIPIKDCCRVYLSQ